jgi:hypothetical protein
VPSVFITVEPQSWPSINPRVIAVSGERKANISRLRRQTANSRRVLGVLWSGVVNLGV